MQNIIKKLPEAVHKEGGKICMQILHSGRYGYHPFNVAPSKIKVTNNILSNHLKLTTIRN